MKVERIQYSMQLKLPELFQVAIKSIAASMVFESIYKGLKGLTVLGLNAASDVECWWIESFFKKVNKIAVRKFGFLMEFY